MTYELPSNAVFLFNKTPHVIKIMGLKTNYSPRHKGIYWGIPRKRQWKIICKKPSCMYFTGSINTYCRKCKKLEQELEQELEQVSINKKESMEDHIMTEETSNKNIDNNYQCGVGGILHPNEINFKVHKQKNNSEKRYEVQTFTGFLVDAVANSVTNNVQMKKINHTIITDNRDIRYNCDISDVNKIEIDNFDMEQTLNEGPVSYYADLDETFNIDLNVKLI
jgi:hypothetical protein